MGLGLENSLQDLHLWLQVELLHLALLHCQAGWRGIQAHLGGSCREVFALDSLAQALAGSGLDSQAWEAPHPLDIPLDSPPGVDTHLAHCILASAWPRIHTGPGIRIQAAAPWQGALGLGEAEGSPGSGWHRPAGQGTSGYDAAATGTSWPHDACPGFDTRISF